MITIQSNNSFKSIRPFDPLNIQSDLVVISGLNGAGKTQLLHGINEGRISATVDGNALLPVKLYDVFRPAITESAKNVSINGNPPGLLEEIRKQFHNFLHFRDIALDSPEVAAMRQYTIASRIPRPSYEAVRLFNFVAKEVGKSPREISIEEIIRHMPPEPLNPPDLLSLPLANIYLTYFKRLEENEKEEFYYQKQGHGNFLSDEDFRNTYGNPPWEEFNRLLATTNLNYSTNFPIDRRRNDFDLRLIYTGNNNFSIPIEDLSSGEKTILSLFLANYNSRHDLNIPSLLLLDEPDSHLHPSFIKQMLNVIQNVFACDKGVKVIMTTHSPSTVALAPEESIYIMNKTAPRLVKATKDKALRLLLSGVPTLSVNYENRRQVFVESKYDVEFYEKAYEKLRDKLTPEISINFISSGVGGAGDCAQVREIVNTLTGYGNRSIYGIIDWDIKNHGNEFVKILGQDNRYSLENYIFDPLLLAAFLLREKIIDRNDLGLATNAVYTDFTSFDPPLLQSIADFIVEKVRPKDGNPAPEKDMSGEMEYVGGQKISLPSWFLTINGHTLEGYFKDLFPALRKYQKEGELKREIIHKVIDDVPDLLSKDILDLFYSIQDYTEMAA